MFAVIKTGGKQYKVTEGDKLVVEKLEGEAGSKVVFDQVLMAGSDKGVKVGAPLLAGAKVTAELVDTFRQDKVMVIKKTRRNTYRRRKGHRQTGTLVKITSVAA